MNRPRIAGLALVGLMSVSAWCFAAQAGERTEHFDRDPGWDGHNNRSAQGAPRTVKQDFGFSMTRHAGGRAAGEAGGLLSPAAEPAYYAVPIAERGFADRLTASGTLAVADGPVHALVGFFNAGTVNEWRTPNTVVLRIQGRGDVFYAYVEYATRRWRAGGDEPRPFARVRDEATGKPRPAGFKAGTPHRWTLTYDPAGNGGAGTVTATIDDQTAVCHLIPGNQAEGAEFNRFGVLNVAKSADSPGELWLDDVTINGSLEPFDRDPGWEGWHNRRIYETRNVRPWFDFGFSPTQFARGQGPGELGGLVFRGDIRHSERMAAYGDRLRPLSLDRPLHASGKVVLNRGVSDSTVLLGFYHAETSLAVNPSQESGLPEAFLGLVVEGPSREGFLAYPAFRTTGAHLGHAAGANPPHILPDGVPHDWALRYVPAADGSGRITLTFDGRLVSLNVPAAGRDRAVTFNRFGLVTTWIDGNSETIYFDDLTYTASQDD